MSISNPIQNLSFNWRLIYLRTAHGVFVIVVGSCTAIVYFALMFRGFIAVLPDLGMKLSKLFGFLDLYTATHKLTLAHVACIIPLTLAFVSMRLLLDLYLRPKTFEKNFSRWESPERLKRVVLIFCASVLIGDMCLFASAFMHSGWGVSKNPIAALVATVVYQACIGLATLCEIMLSEKCVAIQEQGVRNETVS